MNPQITAALEKFQFELDRLKALDLPAEAADEIADAIAEATETLAEIYFNTAECPEDEDEEA